MAKNHELNGSDHLLLQSHNGVEAEDLDDEGNILRSYFVLLALRHRRLLIIAGLGSMVVVFFLTFFVMHPKYQAIAIMRPVGQNPNSLGGLLQTAGIASQSFSGVGLDSDIGTNVHDPDELVAILNSYTFTTAMIQAENLGPKLSSHFSMWSLLPFVHHHPNGSPLWGYYRAMSSRFDCENSVRTGNITMTFIHKDSDFARLVLQLYIDRLRDHLRVHDVAYNQAAAKSLEQAAASASDPMLRDDLYQLSAMQLQKVKTAEANADFAFNVLEKPYVPPDPVKPWVMFDTLLAGVLVPLVIFMLLVVRDRVPEVRKNLAEAVLESERFPDRTTVSRRSRRVPIPDHDRPYSE
jgi:capsular polysaccharide biosynthesis protein